MKFSVMIPVYNVAPYLRECLRSVIAASDKLKVISDKCETEIICIDDGSTDGSSEILDAYLQRPTPTVKVIHQENRGVSAARNRGLEEATGDWILFVDADDVVAPNWLSSVARLINENLEADVVTFGMERFDESGSYDSSIPTGDILGCGFWQFAYRRESIRKVRFPNYVVGEDRVYLFRCLAKARHKAICPEVLYRYRERAGSATHRFRPLRVRWHSFRHSIDLFLLSFRIGEATWRYRLRLFRKIGQRFLALRNGYL